MRRKNLLCFVLFLLLLFPIEGQSAKKEEVTSSEKEAELEKAKEIKFYSLEKEYRKLETQRFHLKKAKVLELKPIIENMLSIYGSVYVNEKDNTIYITDTPEMVDHLKRIVLRLDVEGIVAGGNFVSRVILLKHTNASDIIDLVKHKLSNDGKIFKVGDLNGLIITDIASKISEVENLVKDLDVPIKHLSIEITILELNLEYFEKIGLDIFGLMEKIYPQISYSKSKYKYKYEYEDPERDDYDYDRSSEELRFTIPARFNISDLIELMIRDGKGKVLASPKIITKNNNTAYLNASEMIPYSPSDGYYGGGRELIARAGIYLSVLPIIQQDNFINLRISPRISDLTGWSPKGMPIIFDRSLQTEVNVKDGDTFVLGGLRKTEEVKIVKGIPILKKIPLLKYLFSKTVKISLTREIVMFITPHILKEEQYLPEEDKNLLEEMRDEMKK